MNKTLVFVLSWFFLVSSGCTSGKIILPEKGLCAHRGAMETHPENTIPAFLEAVNAGAHMIEFDVFLTKDNEMVVIHDATVDRTTNGTGKVSDLTLEQIKELDAGGWKADEFTGTKIPTIDEVLAVMPVNIWLNIHLKGEGELPVMVAKKIQSENRLHQAFLACSRTAADLAREAVPEIMICNMDRQEKDVDYVSETIESKSEFIQLRQPITPSLPDYTRLLKENDIRINFFGTDSPEEIKTLFISGVDFPLVNDISKSIRVAVEFGIKPVKPSYKMNRIISAISAVIVVLIPQLSFSQIIPNGDDPLPDVWPESCKRIEFISSEDGMLQPVIFMASSGNEARPLVVSLHTWSGGYDQKDTLVWQCLEKNYNYIHPHFRGRNNNPEACGSPEAVRDIDDAITYAINNSNADRSQIHIIGSSGGGYATLLAYMNSAHDIKTFSAWVPICDLVKWFYESEGRKSDYSKDISKATGGWTDENNYSVGKEEAIKRSPYYMKTPVESRKFSKLNLYAGIHDGYTGSVPITHSLLFYNKVVKDFNPAEEKVLVTDRDIIEMISSRNYVNKPGKTIGNRMIHYEKSYSDRIRIVIFEGGHEQLNDMALDHINGKNILAIGDSNGAAPDGWVEQLKQMNNYKEKHD
ncbi:MAG TPA: hypothetical protein DDW27_03105 [Bacteroidales bacterium]|nr:hypothetical protein [Bacteroidales bacterium]